MSAVDLAPPPRDVVESDVARALAEDIGRGDVTAVLIDAAEQATASKRAPCWPPWPGAHARWSAPSARR
jgi:hypothetical protein